MFTGIVEARGFVEGIQKKGRAMRLVLRVPAAYRKLRSGASVSVDGVCLTVTGRKGSGLSFDVVPETLKRTRFGRLKAGETLNLERPLRWKGRVEGHLVQGHVDGVARVLKSAGSGSRRDFQVALPKKLARLVVEKGSVALNGVSLTVGRKKPGSFWVHVIPHTLQKTNLGSWEKGSYINLETDVWLKAFDNRRRGR